MIIKCPGSGTVKYTNAKGWSVDCLICKIRVLRRLKTKDHKRKPVLESHNVDIG